MTNTLEAACLLLGVIFRGADVPASSARFLLAVHVVAEIIPGDSMIDGGFGRGGQVQFTGAKSWNQEGSTCSRFLDCTARGASSRSWMARFTKVVPERQIELPANRYSMAAQYF